MKVCPTCGGTVPDAEGRCPRDGSLLEAVKDANLGRTVGGRYRLISKLGSGGMSNVYLARHVMIDRLVAVKTLRRDLAKDPVQRDRFIREARAVNRINHDNIVEINDFGEADDGLVYLVMEYVPGEPLFKALAKAPFPAQRALHIAEQIASALGRAHQMKVVHRDLKPENVLLVPRRSGADFVKILDFGIAKIMDAPSLTHSQQIFGTPGYIAPEYIQSSEIDGRADLYSLGVILYEMVTGALPFDYQYPGDLLVKHVADPPIEPRKRLPSVEAPVEELILRCLAKKPDDRFRDAHHFLESLRKTRERIGAPPTSWGAMSEMTPAYPVMRDTDPEVVSRAGVVPLVSQTIAENRAVVDALLRIPSAPVDLTDPTVLDLNVSLPASSPQAEQGLVGVVRWRQRYDALRLAVEELSSRLEIPPPVGDALHFSDEALASLESCVAATEAHQEEMEELDGEAKDFQVTLGRAIDRAAEKLSTARGEFETVARRRNTLRARHEGLSKSVRAGKGDEGEADAVLWELASVEQELKRQATECDQLESQLLELRTQLEVRSDAVQGRRAELASMTAEEMNRLDALALALREPLAMVEGFIRQQWPDEEGQ